jgi:hypothetical protein
MARGIRLGFAGREIIFAEIRYDRPFANETPRSRIERMSLAEIEKQVLALSEEERRQFAAWFYQNEGKILPPQLDDGECGSDVSEAMKAELLLRKQEHINHPERFRRVETRAGLKVYFDEVRDEVRARLSPPR